MKTTILVDAICNVLIPLFLGLVLYGLNNKSILPQVVENHISDGCWAYALQSCILIIWNRKINTFWIIVTALVAISYEMLQYLFILKGTGDMLDIITYLFFLGIAFYSNAFFVKLLYKKTNHDTF